MCVHAHLPSSYSFLSCFNHCCLLRVLQSQTRLAVREHGLMVYGGFVRDWVINGERANDLDIHCPKEKQERVKGSLAFRAWALGYYLKDGGRENGAAWALQFVYSEDEGDVICVDLMDKDRGNFQPSPPGVSSDVDNLCLRSAGAGSRVELLKKVLCYALPPCPTHLPLLSCLTLWLCILAL